MSFSSKVFGVVAEIPKGEVLTYKEVATFAGNPRAYRAVGKILNKNIDTKKYPCHRVIRSDRTLGGYAFGGKSAKKKILVKEGIKFQGNKVI